MTAQTGTDGNDTLYTTVVETATAPYLAYQNGVDSLIGLGGDDRIGASLLTQHDLGFNQALTLDGGDGADTITLYDDLKYAPMTILGGAGNDVISAYGGRGTIDGGAGDDVIAIGGVGGSAQAYDYLDGAFRVTTGAGADRVLFNVLTVDPSTYPYYNGTSVLAGGSAVITDFTPSGPDADTLDISRVARYFSDPFREGSAKLIQSGPDTLIHIAGIYTDQFSLAVLQNVDAHSLTLQTFGLNPNQAAAPVVWTATATGLSVVGADGYEYLTGEGGDDDISGGLGPDFLTGGGGADIFRYSSLADSIPGSSLYDHTYDTILDFEHGSDKIDVRR